MLFEHPTPPGGTALRSVRHRPDASHCASSIERIAGARLDPSAQYNSGLRSITDAFGNRRLDNTPFAPLRGWSQAPDEYDDDDAY